MITHLQYRGGSDTNGGVSITGGTTHQLIPSRLFCYFTATGGSGTVTLKLPNALGLRIGTTFKILLDGTSDRPVEIRTYSSATALNIYDITGVIRTQLEYTFVQWGLFTAVQATLTANTTDNGSWTIMHWRGGE